MSNDFLNIAKAGELYDRGDLYEYRVTDEGPVRMNFVFRIFASLLNMVGYRTNLSVAMQIAEKEIAFANGKSIADLSNQIKSARLDSKALECLRRMNVIFKETVLKDSKNEELRQSREEILTNINKAIDEEMPKQVYEELKEKIESLNEGRIPVTFEDGSSGTSKGDSRKVFHYISCTDLSSAKDQAIILKQFEADISRNNFEFEDDHGVWTRYAIVGGETRKERAAAIVQRLERIATKQDGVIDQDFLFDLKAFCCQNTLNMCLLGINFDKIVDAQGRPACPSEKNSLNKIIAKMERDGGIIQKQDSVTFYISKNGQVLTAILDQKINLTEGCREPHVQLSQRVIWDRDADTLTLEPMYDVTVLEGCTLQDLQEIYDLLKPVNEDHSLQD